jgi:glutaminase
MARDDDVSALVGHYRAVASPLRAFLRDLHAKYQPLRDGKVADYIPELTKANPDWFGICVATVGGQLFEFGDFEQQFTIQSISKPFVYGLAIEDQGRDAVLRRIGVEPTGDTFNAISLESGSGRPLNPMINAGAIAASSLVAGHSPEDAQGRLLAVLSTYAGRPLAVDEAVYESERSTGHRNRAIGHMLRNYGIVTEDPEPSPRWQLLHIDHHSLRRRPFCVAFIVGSSREPCLLRFTRLFKPWISWSQTGSPRGPTLRCLSTRCAMPLRRA